MKKTKCILCGNPDAADFVFKILCPTSGCKNYDAKLAKEQEEEPELELLDLNDLNDGLDDCDFVAGYGYVVDLSDLD